MTNDMQKLSVQKVLKSDMLQDPQHKTLHADITGKGLENNIIFEHYEKGSFLHFGITNGKYTAFVTKGFTAKNTKR